MAVKLGGLANPPKSTLSLSHYLHKAFPSALGIQQKFDHPTASLIVTLTTDTNDFSVAIPHEILMALNNDPWQISELVTSKLINYYVDPQPWSKHDVPMVMPISKEMLEYSSPPWPSVNYNPTPQLVQEQQVVIKVGANLTQFVESFKQMTEAMVKAGQQLAGEFQKVTDALLPCLEEISKIVEEEQVQKMPAKAVLNHPDLKQPVKCPGCDELTSARSLEKVIIDLNDRHKWTRDQIADWLDTLDSQPVFYPQIEDIDGQALKDNV